ncbi:MAG: hypothetical protein V4710_02265, partial [Verrucomicrobiota bacterium]
HETDSVWIAFIAPYLIPLPGAHLYEPVPADDVAYVAAGYRFERKPGGSVDRVPRFGEPATLINRLWFLDALMAYRNENGKPDRLCTFEQFAFEHAESESGDRSALQISEVVGGLPDLKNHGFLNFKHLKGWLDEFLKRAGRADGPLSKTLLGPSLRARLCSWTEKKSVKPMAARTRTDAQS